MAAGLAIALAIDVIGKLGEMAGRQLINEATLVANFSNDFQWLKKKLTHVTGYLRSADEQSSQHEPVKEWLQDVRDIAFDAEDILDECFVEPLYNNTTQSCVCSYSQLIFRFKMGRRIKNLKDRMRSIVQDAEELKLFYDLSHLDQPSTITSQEGGAELRRPSILESDSSAVAIDYKVDQILSLLEDPAVRVMSVVGMGGLGKTFLMLHVFDRTKQRYEDSAWISISQKFSVRSLQSDLASHIDLRIDSSVSDVRAAELIHERLRGKKCLIVLDDVWRASGENDLISRLGLPIHSNSLCKIVVTTRSRDVFANMHAHVYEMKGLSEEDSWKLFCFHAFPDGEENRPPLAAVEGLARQIVKECGGLPLAIKTVAASMAKSSLLKQSWESKLKQLKEVANTEDSTMQILQLSYDSLQSHLKSCFAYFSFFPEDTRISREYLIRLWIAEGFIPHGEEQWDIALNYLHQLVNLCLVEVDIFGRYFLHDLLHDLAIHISKDNKCEFALPSGQTSCRRLLLAKKDIDTNAISDSSLDSQRCLRTLSLAENSQIQNIPEHLFDRLRVLRVLVLRYTKISTLPECVGKLKLLKFLDLANTEIRQVPECVRRLNCLQFLNVCYCTRLQQLPDWIGELKCLSYLNICSYSPELVSHMPKEMSKLLSLRILRSDPVLLSIEENEFLNLKDVGNLIRLQELRFCFKDEGVLKSVEDGVLEHLVKMRILLVRNDIPAREGDRESFLPSFPEKMKVMTDLQKLDLTRFSVPSWVCGLVNLKRLWLRECSDYPSLQTIPNLEQLYLDKDSKCTELPKNFGQRGAFPKLRLLVIGEFHLLEELPALEDGAMSRLEELRIINCPRIKKVPDGLEGLKRLKEMVYWGSPNSELSDRLKEEGEDWNKIRANKPHVTIKVTIGST